MEATASVITLIAFSVDSTKLIYNILTGIEDGPESLGLTISSVKILQGALEQLAHRLAASRQLPPVEFQIQVKKCADDLGAFASKLRKFVIQETDSRARKLWKRFKAVLGEKDFERMTEVVGAYASTLNFYMASLSGLDTQHLELLRSDLARADVQRQQQLSAISNSLDHASSTTASTQAMVNQGVQLLAANLNESRAQSEANQQEMNNKLSLVLDAIQSLAARTNIATTLESHGVRSQEREIVRNGSLPDALSTTYHHAVPPLEREVPAIILENEKVLDCINRLCSMTSQDEDTANEETVDSVIEDLQTIVRAVMSQSKDRTSVRDLRRVSGLLDSAQTLSINGQAQRSPRPNQLARNEQHLEIYEIGNGTLKVRTKRRYLQHHPTEGEKMPEKQRSEVGHTTSTLTFLPNVRTGTMFSAIIQQQTSAAGFFSPIPFFQANYIRPADSLVFQLVREGRLSEFVELLREGKASLRDHDELGRPLLWIAAVNQQPPMCRYLLEKDADPDVHSLIYDNDPEEIPLIGACMLNDDEEEEEIVRQANECRRILLEGGADPTTDSEYAGPAFSAAFENTSNVKVRGNFRRVGKYTEEYQWSDFRLLWSGYEHFCPYPEDLVEALSDRTACGEENDEDGNSCSPVSYEGDSDEGESSYGSIGSINKDSDNNDPEFEISNQNDINIQITVDEMSVDENSGNESGIDDKLDEDSKLEENETSGTESDME
ncbi:unnamed protein product, partial [Clonostachys rosea]